MNATPAIYEEDYIMEADKWRRKGIILIQVIENGREKWVPLQEAIDRYSKPWPFTVQQAYPKSLRQK